MVKLVNYLWNARNVPTAPCLVAARDHVSEMYDGFPVDIAKFIVFGSVSDLLFHSSAAYYWTRCIERGLCSGSFLLFTGNLVAFALIGRQQLS